jgi:hypothetical protein
VIAGSFLTHHHLHGLAGLVVGHADGGAFQHAGHLRDDVLDLVRVHVEAAHQDHVLLAVDDLEVAALVDHADVAGAEEAVGGHHLGGLVGALPVAGHHLRAADGDLARRAQGHLVAVVVEQAMLGAGHGQADVAAVGRAVHRVAGGRRAGLGQAVALADRAAGLVEPQPRRGLCTAMPPPTLIFRWLQSTLSKSGWLAMALNSVLTAGKLWKAAPTAP